MLILEGEDCFIGMALEDAEVQEVYTGPQVWLIAGCDVMGRKSIFLELWILPVSEQTSSAHWGRAVHSWQAHPISISISASADKSERQSRGKLNTRQRNTAQKLSRQGNNIKAVWFANWLMQQNQFPYYYFTRQKIKGGGRYITTWSYLNLEENI